LHDVKGLLKTFWTPMHPVRLHCENSENPDILAFSRLVNRASTPKITNLFFRVPWDWSKLWQILHQDLNPRNGASKDRNNQRKDI